MSKVMQRMAKGHGWPDDKPWNPHAHFKKVCARSTVAAEKVREEAEAKKKAKHRPRYGLSWGDEDFPPLPPGPSSKSPRGY